MKRNEIRSLENNVDMAASGHDTGESKTDTDTSSSYDDESVDICQAGTSKEIRPPYEADRHKISDTDFKYNCEWTACSYIASSMTDFQEHVIRHFPSPARSLSPDEEIFSAQSTFYCQWQGCNARIDGQIDDFTRHVFYHTFHQFLKFQGQHIQKIENLKKCTLSTVACNIIPELPEKLLCRWEDCGMVYDNPYIFYSHASHHWEDYPKGNNPNIAFKCKWEGCTAICKSGHKLREHIRSHTQAKVVACPTCGSLFASNTRFIDHLIRQELDPKHRCLICAKMFPSKKLLNQHVSQHSKKHECIKCSLSLPSLHALRRHILYCHTEDRKFICTDCNYRAKTKGDLKQHLKNHQGEEMFPCTSSGCGQRFKKRKLLLEHYSSEHEVYRKYGCHICAKNFTRGTLLSTHLIKGHNYRWPHGHRRFRYSLCKDGIRRLENIQSPSVKIQGQDLIGEPNLPFQASSSVSASDHEEMRRVHLVVEEKISLTAGRGGELQNMEVHGMLRLRINDEKASKIKFKVTNNDTKGIQLQTDPNIDKKLFSQTSVICLKNPEKPFPVGQDIKLLKWEFQTQDDSHMPLSIYCWPYMGGEVYIEYVLEQENFELEDVQINIPCPSGVGAPVINKCNGEHHYDSHKRTLQWRLPFIDASNKSGSMEFNVNGQPDDFFPVTVNFTSKRSFCDITINEVQQIDGGAVEKYSSEVLFYVEKYEVV